MMHGPLSTERSFSRIQRHPLITEILPDTNDCILDRQFTIQELRRGIKQLKNKKAPGIDGYINEVWKSLPPQGLIVMCELFNKIYTESCVPYSWCTVCICPLHKKGDPSVPSNYRPISLVSTKLKLFTTILNNRLMSWNVRRNVLSEFQAAYRPGLGCYHHNFLLNTIIDSRLRLNKKLFCLYVDLSGAFDSVKHDLLWNKLQSAGISEKFISCIKSVYSSATARIRTASGFTDALKIKIGVLQGESLSPTLFNFHVNDVVSTMESSFTSPVRFGDRNFHILLYADDMVLMAS